MSLSLDFSFDGFLPAYEDDASLILTNKGIVSYLEHQPGQSFIKVTTVPCINPDHHIPQIPLQTPAAVQSVKPRRVAAESGDKCYNAFLTALRNNDITGMMMVAKTDVRKFCKTRHSHLGKVLEHLICTGATCTEAVVWLLELIPIGLPTRLCKAARTGDYKFLEFIARTDLKHSVNYPTQTVLCRLASERNVTVLDVYRRAGVRFSEFVAHEASRMHHVDVLEFLYTKVGCRPSKDYYAKLLFMLRSNRVATYPRKLQPMMQWYADKGYTPAYIPTTAPKK